MKEPQSDDAITRMAEIVRQACIDAAIQGYERARISGLCNEGAWEAAVSAVRMLDLHDALQRRRDIDERSP